MKQHNTPTDNLRDIEVPQASMDAMAQQIRALERASTLRKRIAAWSAAAAVAVIVAVAWSILATIDGNHSTTEPLLTARKLPVAPRGEASPEPSVELPPAPVATAVTAPPRRKRPVHRAVRPAAEQYVADNAPVQEEVEHSVNTAQSDMQEDCPVMVYDSGKLVACGSLESIPEVYEIFHEVAGTVEDSQQVISSGVETLGNIVKTINNSEQQ